jgi:glycosyltransferase involved in cell wall biosynthesis
MNERRAVLLMTVEPPDAAALQRAVSTLRREDRDLLLATQRPLDAPAAGLDALVTGLDGSREVGPAAAERGPAFRRALRAAADRPERFWLHVRDDDWVAGRLADVDVVVPLDEHAHPAGVRLTEEHPHLTLADDVDAAASLLRSHGEDHGRPRTSLPSRGKGLSRGLRGRLRIGQAARAQQASAEALDLLRHGHDAEAQQVVSRTLGKLTRPRLRADLLGDVVSWGLAHGRQPALAQDAYAAELAVADRHHAAGEHDEAAASVMEAMRTAFHPVLHFDGPRSPLADDPAGFTAPLRESVVAGVLRRGPRKSGAERLVPPPQGEARERQPREGEPREGQPREGEPRKGQPREGEPRTRLLIATQHNADFLGEILDHFEGHPDFDTRFELFKDTPAVRRFGKQPTAFVEQVLAGRPELPRALESTFREQLDRSDVVLVEWATALAALVSRMDHAGTRVVVRLHSYEAFSQWPHLTSWANIDDVVFVSDHLRDLAVAAVPGLSGPRAPRLHVVPNAMPLQRFVRLKEHYARFTLAVVGASKVVKDPRWAIEVLRLVRRHDERYRLLLVRGDVQDVSAATHEYVEELERDLAELEPIGAVERVKHTDDVPTVLEDVGVVLSSSVRESFHLGLVEGVASGALPVVRDWPFFPGAARQLFPADWVVGSPQEAAERILDLTADEKRWRAATTAAAEHVLGTWDWTVVRTEYERLLRR